MTDGTSVSLSALDKFQPLTPTIIPLFPQTVAGWIPYLQDLISASEANVKDDKSFKTMTDNSLGY